MSELQVFHQSHFDSFKVHRLLNAFPNSLIVSLQPTTLRSVENRACIQHFIRCIYYDDAHQMIMQSRSLRA